ncbi:MAG: hypothetical protein J3R72DRAFT_454519 [Linnemannia gamsii]|nr:MAG: hypothetical protein J3R72DRAFT_454519 [Linnemannia gamsii]
MESNGKTKGDMYDHASKRIDNKQGLLFDLSTTAHTVYASLSALFFFLFCVRIFLPSPLGEDTIQNRSQSTALRTLGLIDRLAFVSLYLLLSMSMGYAGCQH